MTKLSRRDVVKLASTAALLPAVRVAAWVPETPRPKDVAEAALLAAKQAGAQYADARLVRMRHERIQTRDENVVHVGHGDSFGIGVRVLKRGAWGFCATPEVSPAGAKRAALRAVAIAEANASLQTRAVELAPEPSHQDSWQTPIERDPLRVPLSAKTGILLEAAKAARAVPGVKRVQGQYYAVLEEKSFFSSEGSAIEQMLYRIDAGYGITATDDKKGEFETRNHPLPPASAGFEHVERGRLVEDAPRLAKEAVEKLKADKPTPGPKDLILDPSHLWLTIHESIGHSTELDRVLGYEANYAGTSFATVDQLGKLRYGGAQVRFYADRTTPGGLGTCRYDDDGVKTGRWDIIKDGVLVGYQTIRDQRGLPGFGGPRSTGCSYAQGWDNVPFQRMPNISLSPGDSPLSLQQLIASTDDGIYIQGEGSYSIDHQRKNFQFGGDGFWEVKKGKITRPLRKVAYQSTTLEFWAKMDAVCDAREWKLYGSMQDGKGEPGQSNPVSHGCAPARFRKVRVLDTTQDTARREA
jgi:TldD protein